MKRAALVFVLCILVVMSDNYLRAVNPETASWEKLPPSLPEHFGSIGLDQHPNIRFDDDGVPLTKIWTTGEYRYNPTFIAGWGLVSILRYTSSKSLVDRERFIKMSDWLVQHQSPNGGFPLDFDHVYPSNGYRLLAPWYSAVSQALGISLLIRAFQETGRNEYLSASAHALNLFKMSTTEGGLRGEQNGLPCYEETPDPRDPNHILNGHIFALLAIHDLYLATRNTEGLELWEAGESSLRKNVNEYVVKDAPSELNFPMPWGLYDVQHKSIPVNPNYVDNMYLRMHIRLLRDLVKRTGYSEYEDIAAKWDRSLIEHEERDRVSN